MKGVFLYFIIQKEFLKKAGGWGKKLSFVYPKAWLACSGVRGVFYLDKTSLSACISSQATVAPVQGGENLLRMFLGSAGRAGRVRVCGRSWQSDPHCTRHRTWWVRGTRWRLALKCTVSPYLALRPCKHGRLCMKLLWWKHVGSLSVIILLLSYLNLAQNKSFKYMWDIAQLEDVTCLSIKTKVIIEVDACTWADLTSLFWRQIHTLQVAFGKNCR